MTYCVLSAALSVHVRSRSLLSETAHGVVAYVSPVEVFANRIQMELSIKVVIRRRSRRNPSDRNQWIYGFSPILRRVWLPFRPLNPINQAIKTFTRNNHGDFLQSNFLVPFANASTGNTYVPTLCCCASLWFHTRGRGGQHPECFNLLVVVIPQQFISS